MTLKEKIGQKLIVGLKGNSLSSEFIHLVKDYKIGNVILFKQNIKNPAQLRSLCLSIQELVQQETGYPALIGIDQEGGGVSRLPGDFNVPGQMALAASGDPQNAQIAAEITSHMLQSFEINFNFAPVVDINSNPHNPIIGRRAYGDTAEKVISYALAALKGYQNNHFLCCAKHFPGHGDTTDDSHLSLPRIDKSFDELEELELRPFKTMIDADCPSIMVAHILYTNLQTADVPSSMSREIITGLLREKYGFSGLVVSDCMEMDAIHKYYGTVEGAIEAIKAGTDLVIISHSAKLAEEAAQHILEKVRCNKISLIELDESVSRILRYKKEYCRENACYEENRKKNAQQEDDKIKAEKKEIWNLREKSIVLQKGVIPELRNEPIFVSCREFQAGLVFNEEDEVSFAEYMAKKLGGMAILVSQDPDDEEMLHILSKISVYPKDRVIVIGTYNAYLFHGQKELIYAIGETGHPLVVIALGNPYDLSDLPDKASGIAIWEYSREMFDVLIPILEGKRKPTGVMPVKIEDE